MYMYMYMYVHVICMQKEREVKRQRKLLEQQLERMDSRFEDGSEGQSSTALVAIDDCKSLHTTTNFLPHSNSLLLIFSTYR